MQWLETFETTTSLDDTIPSIPKLNHVTSPCLMIKSPSSWWTSPLVDDSPKSPHIICLVYCKIPWELWGLVIDTYTFAIVCCYPKYLVLISLLVKLTIFFQQKLPESMSIHGLQGNQAAGGSQVRRRQETALEVAAWFQRRPGQISPTRSWESVAKIRTPTIWGWLGDGVWWFGVYHIISYGDLERKVGKSEKQLDFVT